MLEMLAQADVTKALGDVVAGKDVATVLGGMLTLAFIVIVLQYRENRTITDRERVRIETQLATYQKHEQKGDSRG